MAYSSTRRLSRVAWRWSGSRAASASTVGSGPTASNSRAISSRALTDRRLPTASSAILRSRGGGQPGRWSVTCPRYPCVDEAPADSRRLRGGVACPRHEAAPCPGLVAVVDVAEEDRRPVIVMELVDTPTLADVVA